MERPLRKRISQGLNIAREHGYLYIMRRVLLFILRSIPPLERVLDALIVRKLSTDKSASANSPDFYYAV